MRSSGSAGPRPGSDPCSGCRHDRLSPLRAEARSAADRAIPDDYRARHPIVLAEGETTLDVPVSAGDTHIPLATRDLIRASRPITTTPHPAWCMMLPDGAPNSTPSSACAGIRAALTSAAFPCEPHRGDALPRRKHRRCRPRPPVLHRHQGERGTVREWPEDLVMSTGPEPELLQFRLRHAIEPRRAGRKPDGSARSARHVAGRCRTTQPRDQQLPNESCIELAAAFASGRALALSRGAPEKRQEQKMTTIDYTIDTDVRKDSIAVDTTRPGDLDIVRPLPRISIHAFCESEGMLHLLDQCARDRRSRRSRCAATRARSLQRPPRCLRRCRRPNLIILETSVDPANLLGELAPLAEVCDASTKVIIIAKHNDIRLYRELIRNGISNIWSGRVPQRHPSGRLEHLHRPPTEPLAAPSPSSGKGRLRFITVAHNCAWGISSLFSTGRHPRRS